MDTHSKYVTATSSSLWMEVQHDYKPLSKYIDGKVIDTQAPEIIKDLDDWAQSEFLRDIRVRH